ncbi:alpha/beta hydrolase [Streptomyces sp. NPDC051577]|uniref:alpha/beta hydrolase n=1 Tax=Streptomyces sp. NPDC051577 TaxID=3155166 RepID=UPI00341D346E
MGSFFSDEHKKNIAALDKNKQSEIRRWKNDADAIQKALDAVDKELKGAAQLWKYEPSAEFKDGTLTETYCRIALSIGDLDTAQFVVFIVPGTTHSVNGSILTDKNSDFGSLPGPADISKGGTLVNLVSENAIPLYEKCKNLNSSKKCAVVLWMGYRAPMAELRGPGIWAFAIDGAQKLIADVLQFKEKSQARLTISGHSYGSTTVGTAAKHFKKLPNSTPLADSLVLLGSPGACAMKANELGPPEEIYVCSDYYDIITYLAAFGRDPAAKQFGAVTLKSKVPGLAFKRDDWMVYLLKWGARRIFGGTTSHSYYYHPKNPSSESIARVVIQEGVGDVKKCAGRSLMGSWSEKKFNWNLMFAALRSVGISPAVWKDQDLIGAAAIAYIGNNFAPQEENNPNEEPAS